MTTTTTPPTAPPAPSPATRSRRLPGPDVTRAVALLGVITMNYHGYLNGSDASAVPGDSRMTALFDPWRGVLSTRFAATFVVMAGVGITLLTDRARRGGDHTEVSALRWRLARRGLFLYGLGFVLDWIWPGTILFFYGALFVLGALVFTLRTRWVVALGAGAAVAGAAIAWWEAIRVERGHDVGWLTSPDTLRTRSPRGLLFDTFVNGTHPVLPWFAFLCAGIVLGRALPHLHRGRVAAVAAAVTACTYLVNHVAGWGTDDAVRTVVLSTRPFDRGLLYTAGTLGTSLVAYCACSWLAERFATTAPVQVLANAGRTTLSIYVMHVLVFNEVVHQRHWVGGEGLGTAIGFALVVWVLAVLMAAWWQRFIGQGPMERIYRRLGA